VEKERAAAFIEQAADVLEEQGLPHMAGRVIGALLVCVPPYLSLEELGQMLQASRGAISMATQLLLRLGFAERRSLPGERKHFIELRPGFMERSLADLAQIEKHQELIRNGIALMRDEPTQAKARLIELKAYVDFLAEELPGMAARWERRRSERIRDSIGRMG